MHRRDWLRLMTATAAAGEGLLLSSPARAQRAVLVEGQTFARLTTPLPRPAAGKIEVIEFFSYACPHCNDFEPTLEAWARKLPPDVLLRRVPVYFLMNAANFQKTYYALEAMGLVDRMQLHIFAAVHVEHQRLGKPEELAAVVAKHGGDGRKFLSHFESFSVDSAVTQAGKLTRDCGIDTGPGVPALVVDGRFLTSPAHAGSGPQALAVVDALIQRARKG